MKNELLLYSLIYVFAVFVSAVSQIMLKISAKKSYKSKIRESSGYIFVTILGTTILKEKLSRKKMIGMAVILLGICVFTL